MVKRAITLAGGGPAAGLHIGALRELEAEGIRFDVWALACIGAWVGVVYNTFEPSQAPKLTEQFFRENVFRNDASYSRFPVNHAFAPDLMNNWKAMMQFAMDPATYKNLIVPEAIEYTSRRMLQYMSHPKGWNQGDFDHLVLELCAANPVTRYMTSLMWLSRGNGLSRIYFPHSSLLDAIAFDNLRAEDKPFIYHNAWDLDHKEIQLFSNRPEPGMKPLSAASLCACSALPFVEETVTIDGVTYCEGALVQTVDFDKLLSDHPDLEEVWVVRIVAQDQVRLPTTLYDGLNNLCMLFAASLGKDNIEIFTNKAVERGTDIKIVDLPVSSEINFDWNESNLNLGIEMGAKGAREAVAAYRAKVTPPKSSGGARAKAV